MLHVEHQKLQSLIVLSKTETLVVQTAFPGADDADPIYRVLTLKTRPKVKGYISGFIRKRTPS